MTAERKKAYPQWNRYAPSWKGGRSPLEDQEASLGTGSQLSIEAGAGRY